MLKQLWITGVLAAFSIFGIKAGLGLGSYIYSRSFQTGKKIMFLSATFLTYMSLFFCLYYIITRFHLSDYLNHIMSLLRYGMILHFIVAIGLLFWGLRLLFQNIDKYSDHLQKAGILLIVPCPVCATVVLLNLTLACSLFSLHPLFITMTLFSIFIGIVFFTTALIFPFRYKIHSGNSFLGLSMIFVSLYFLLTIIIAPIYPELNTAFSMAVSNNPVDHINPLQTTLFIVTVFIIGSYGFIRNYFLQGEQM